MSYAVIEDFGTPLQVAEKMTSSGQLAVKARPILEFISEDMIRVTGILWETRAARFGGWKRLAPSTISHKGNTRILFTEGSNPSYTPHPDENVLADSVTVMGGRHQILNVTNRTIEFGTDIKYAKRQYAVRPFIMFSKYDRDRWSRWIVNYITKPFTTKTLVTTPRIRMPRVVAPARVSVQSYGPAGGAFTSIPAFGGGFMTRGPSGRFTGVHSRPRGYGHSGSIQ